MKIAPCKGCTKRTAACWGTCEEYKKWTEERLELKRKIAVEKHKLKDLNNTLYGYRVSKKIQKGTV